MADFSTAISGAENVFGGLGTLLFGGQQFGAQEQAYNTAADYASQNEQIAKYSTAIQQAQAQRKVNLVAGQQRAAQGANGFTEGGSAIDVLRDTTTQGHLTQEMLGTQGLLNEMQYEEQVGQYQAEAKAAAAAQQDSTFGAIGNVVGGIAKIGAMFL